MATCLWRSTGTLGAGTGMAGSIKPTLRSVRTFSVTAGEVVREG